MIGRRTLFLAVLLILAAPSPARAYGDCYRDCMEASGCWSGRSDENVSYCSDTQARCSSQCRDAAPGGGAKIYGAIAYSKRSGAYGYSHGWTNQKKAELVALKNCKDNGPGCESTVWFYDSCGSVASDGKNVTWGHGDTARAAAQEALKKCNQKWFKGKCEEKVTHCSG